MPIENAAPEYESLNHALAQQNVGMTAAEMHGFISGLVCGGNNDESWRVMVHDLTNNGLAFSYPLNEAIDALYRAINAALDDGGFEFDLFMPDDETLVYERIEALAGWVNHFLLGLGMMQPTLSQFGGDVGEAIRDLQDIARLGYDEEDSPETLENALVEIVEYVRMSAILCHSEFAIVDAAESADVKPTLH